ncbi:MAG: ectonucleotide pyrophosphatase/phosphodiesterase, partial [bacterium]
MTRYFGKMVRCCALVFSLLILAALVNLGCKTAEEASDYDFESGLILISLDGFRWDYMEKADTPNLDRLVANGVKAEGLIPVFPSTTFPNHYSVVTGLFAENHGIVANNMYDPKFDASFGLGNQEAVQDGRWWGGEPFWVTVEKQGKIAATYFWPGSEAEISGYRPTHYVPYDGSVPNRDRVNHVLAWLDLP